jgi:YD repeat-containing protein
LPPYTQTDVYTSYNGAAPNDVETVFDANEDPLTVAQYDFGVAMGAAPSSSLLLAKTSNYYGQSWNGSSCSAYPAGIYISATPCYTVTTNSAGSPVAATQIAYNNTGHPQTTKKWVSGSLSTGSFLTATATYNPSNGTVVTSTDQTGVGSTYYYNGTGECNDLLPTSVVSGGLTNATQWNCSGAVPTNTTDPNGQVTQYTYNDPLWRIMSMTDPMLDLTTYS